MKRTGDGYGRRALERDKYLSQEEIRRLCRAVEGRAAVDLARGRTTWPRNWAVIDFLVSTGARASEVCLVRIEDLDLGRKEPKVKVWTLKATRANSNGKGRPPFRWLPLSERFREHMQEFLVWKRRVGEPCGPEDPLFVSNRGTPLQYITIQKIFKRCLEEAGLPRRYGTRSVRHSYGTYQYHATKDLRLVQELLGHASPTTTQIYTAVVPEEKAKAANALDALYRGEEEAVA